MPANAPSTMNQTVLLLRFADFSDTSPPVVQSNALIAIVIVIVPIAIVMPAMIMLIPPHLTFSPAPFAGFVQFLAPAIGLPAEVSMALNGLMEFAFRVNSTLVATIICRCRGHHEEQPRRERGQG
jgi:hypothetical protein